MIILKRSSNLSSQISRFNSSTGREFGYPYRCKIHQDIRLTFGRISAICRGAVARGISDRAILNHISKYNYGISFAEAFTDGQHPREQMVEDNDFPGTYQVFLMNWYLKKVNANPPTEI